MRVYTLVKKVLTQFLSAALVKSIEVGILHRDAPKKSACLIKEFIWRIEAEILEFFYPSYIKFFLNM